MSSLELDIDAIEQFDEVDEKYGPLILIVYDKETGEIVNKYPIIKQLEPEDEMIVYSDEHETIKRKCYILTNGGFIIYVKESKDV